MRTFVAIDIPETMRSEICALVAALRAATRNIRWTRPEGLHITLKFIGESSLEKVDEITAALRGMPKPAPFSLAIRGSGFYPHARAPRVLWLGIEAGRELAGLARQIDATLAALGIPKEDRPYNPHLTLGRVNGAGKLEAVQALLEQRGAMDLGSFQAAEYSLYESQLSPGGSVYKQLARFPFAAAD